MNRAMFSGVAGLKTHQTKMDVIGNNIANVNTYGYKSQRAIFSDIYYQTLRGASAPTTSRGGTNPSSVGYGSSLAAIQTQMNSSSMQNTGFGLDVAIMGEGFLQVMDNEGNIFYTKAGMLDYDSNGYLTDINGNFVLGSGTGDGDPDSQKIRLDNAGTVDTKRPTAEKTINGIKYTIEATNATRNGNVGLSIGASEKLPAGQKAVATISSTGGISVQLNSFESFASMAELNAEINKAIKEANGGKDHAAGTFSIKADKDGFAAGPLTGAEIGSTSLATTPGSMTGVGVADGFFGGGVKFEGTSTDFTGNAAGISSDAFTAKYTAANGAVPAKWDMSIVVGGKTYSGSVDANSKASSVLLKDAAGEYIKVSYPGSTSMEAEVVNQGKTLADQVTLNGRKAGEEITFDVTAAKPSKNLGLSSTSFSLMGGTEGGAVTLDELSGIAIGTDGTVSVSHPDKGVVVVGKISLANFSNPRGLQLEGNNYFSTTVNSGEPNLCDPGTEGTGNLKNNALEMSNVDLSSEFADMITTQRGFQANSRIITVSDTMLEELINLKR